MYVDDMIKAKSKAHCEGVTNFDRFKMAAKKMLKALKRIHFEIAKIFFFFFVISFNFLSL